MRGPHPDEGFTLVELLLAVMIMLIIIVPISASFILGLKTASGSFQDTTNSADAQVLAGFFDTDVTNAETVATSSTCAGAGTFLSLTWKDGTVPVEVAYRSIADPTMQSELKTTAQIDRIDRVRCENGAAVSTTPVVRSVVDSSGVILTCDGGPCSSATPRRVSLSVVDYTTQLADTAATTYTVAVTATRKVLP